MAGHRFQGTQALVVLAPSSRAQADRLWCLSLSMRDLPGSGVDPASPSLAGGFFTTEPTGKLFPIFLSVVNFWLRTIVIRKDAGNNVYHLKFEIWLVILFILPSSTFSDFVLFNIFMLILLLLIVGIIMFMI